MKRLFNNMISVFVVLIVLFLLIPLPPFLLDVFFIFNISISLIILLITMNIKEALEFSIFPSLLLITTLFRLGLNISSTRLILSENGQAGEVIKLFGEFVIQGNIVIGIIIFLIIVLMQFIVITKGAERVSEVAARFTLDSMPGKQMAIDADLSSGLINEQQAKERREEVQREADFYGAMDGATKIVKGDAIMSLIITSINFIAGFIIGIVQSGMDVSQALSVYSIATIGDGLVSQLPSLMISTATGMIVTRSVAEGSLNKDVIKQFLAQPQALMIAAVILALFGIIPGTPHIQLFIIAGALFFISNRVTKNMKELEKQKESIPAAEELARKQAEAQQTEMDYYKDVNNVYSLIHIEPIEMEFGYSLIPLVDESNGGKLISRIVIFRRQYAQEMGFVIPSIRLRDASMLGTNQYVIKIRGEEVARGEILLDYYLALEPSSPAGEIEGIETIEPAYGIPSRWILPENKEMAEIYGYTVIDPLSVMLTHLSETVKKHTHELLDRAETIQLVEHMKKTAPQLVEEAFPNVVSYAMLEKILGNLLKEGIPIKDMGTIVETTVDALNITRDTDLITETVRARLKRTITHRFCQEDKLNVITLDAEVEKKIVASLVKNEQGVYLAIGPDLMQTMLAQLGENIKKFSELGQKPILLTSHVIRIYLKRLLEQFYPDLIVLSFNEIVTNIQIQALGNITSQ